MFPPVFFFLFKALLILINYTIIYTLLTKVLVIATPNAGTIFRIIQSVTNIHIL